VTRSCGGGSSGGAAAIVCAGGSPFDIGSDSGGSIRLPAHFCGVAGLKPTSGRVPRTGHIISYGGVMDGWTQLGPLARRVEDLALLLPIIAGSDWRDPGIVDMPLGTPDRVQLKMLRVAFHTENGIDAPTPAVAQTVLRVAKVLAESGAIVEEAKPPMLESTEAVALGVATADGGEWVRRLVERAGTKEMSRMIQGWTREVRPVTSAQLTTAIEAMDQYRSQFLSFMEQYDVMLGPVEAYSALTDGAMLARDHAETYVFPYNMTGQPAAVVRAGTSDDGMPIGVQIAARHWREDVALAVAAHVEAALGGWTKPGL
jgi:amidase